MDAPEISTLTTVAGAAILTTVLMQFVILPLLNLSPATQDRFGAIIAIIAGVVIVEAATFTVVTGPTRQDVAQGLVNGIFAGLSAIGIHSVASGVTRPSS